MQEVIKNRISIVMASYNCERYLSEAIESILAQTYADFELILIDDGSKDRSYKIIEKYAKCDERIRCIANQENVGLATSLNIGIASCRGEFIARMDADDIALPTRLEVQFKTLKNHPDLAFIGSNAEIIDCDDNKLYITNLYQSPPVISSLSILFNCFIHPSVMIRASALKDVEYNAELDTTQDWALWIDLIFNGAKGDNISEPLMRFRHHNKSVSKLKRNRQIENSLKIQKRYLERLGAGALWDKKLFSYLNNYFLNDRLSFTKDGLSRPAVSLELLIYFERVGQLLPKRERDILHEYLMKRALQIAIMPPIEEKNWNLIIYLLSSPLKLARATFKLISRKNAQ